MNFLWHLVFHIKGRKQTDSVWKQGAEGNICTYIRRRFAKLHNENLCNLRLLIKAKTKWVHTTHAKIHSENLKPWDLLQLPWCSVKPSLFVSVLKHFSFITWIYLWIGFLINSLSEPGTVSSSAQSHPRMPSQSWTL